MRWRRSQSNHAVPAPGAREPRQGTRNGVMDSGSGSEAERNNGNRTGRRVMVVISRPPIKRTPLSAADSGRMRHSVSTKGRHPRISQFSQLAE